jgi:hypothetical protein
VGPFSGRFDGVAFNLRYFDGLRAALLEIEPQKDQGLKVTITEPAKDTVKFTAHRAARAE